MEAAQEGARKTAAAALDAAADGDGDARGALALAGASAGAVSASAMQLPLAQPPEEAAGSLGEQTPGDALATGAFPPPEELAPPLSPTAVSAAAAGARAAHAPKHGDSGELEMDFDAPSQPRAAAAAAAAAAGPAGSSDYKSEASEEVGEGGSEDGGGGGGDEKSGTGKAAKKAKTWKVTASGLEKIGEG